MIPLLRSDPPPTPDSCGHPSRLIRTDGLTGHIITECADCDHLAAVRERREAFDRAAFARMAELAGVTIEVVRRRLRIKPPRKPRMPRPRRAPKAPCVPTCTICGIAIEWRHTGRPPKYCRKDLPPKLAYEARRRGDLRLLPVASIPSHAVEYQLHDTHDCVTE